ncbi:GGDEF domain-containing protein [Pseudocolwellia sp. HL-MZ19]|uniref:GGDEF domain-containing protein n=1 Tax=unclassified Pseudocolwellia TaxID=2848178 RepID=UPI003CE8330C
MHLINYRNLLALIITIFFTLFFSMGALASEEEEAFYIPIFSLNAKIEKLIELNELKSATATSLSESLKADFDKLNSAEQYLYLVVQANNTQGINQHHQTIDFLLQAKSLEPKINSDQLSRLAFINLYQTLADSYAGIGQFQKAYDAKNTFIAKYDAYLIHERAKHIFSLEEKYETHRKKDINTLLNNQTELKALEIDESLNNEVLQRRNIYIVSFLVLLFIGLLLRLLATNKHFHELSKQDILTGIRNRKTLFRHGKSAIRRCTEARSGLCLFAIKIDNFKLLNDIHGDYIGDELLKKFALLSTESMRTRDILGRLEDATFIAVLPEASIDEAKAIAQHLKAKVAAYKFDYVGIDQQLGMSVGIVELSESLNNFELLLNTAMNVLYEIKDGGGKQIKIYQQDAQ